MMWKPLTLLSLVTTASRRLAAERNQPVVLVSGNRRLSGRVRASGAEVVSPSWLLARLPS